MSQSDSFATRGASDASPRRQMVIAAGGEPRAEAGWFARLTDRRLETEVVVLDDAWLRESGVQRQLEFDGFQLRWVTSGRIASNLNDGWSYVTVSHWLWWERRIRRRHGRETQYLLKRTKSLR